MTGADVAELVAIMSAAFTRPPMTERTCQVYERMLVDLDREAAHRAVARLVNTSKWLPTIAEIRAAAVELQVGARRAGAEAWGDVVETIRRSGRYRTPEFTDPLVAECVRSLGWLSLCDSTNDTADRARFIELYDSLAERTRRDLVAGESLALPPPRQPSALKAVPGAALIGRSIQ